MILSSLKQYIFINQYMGGTVINSCLIYRDSRRIVKRLPSMTIQCISLARCFSSSLLETKTASSTRSNNYELLSHCNMSDSAIPAMLRLPMELKLQILTSAVVSPHPINMDILPLEYHEDLGPTAIVRLRELVRQRKGILDQFKRVQLVCREFNDLLYSDHVFLKYHELAYDDLRLIPIYLDGITTPQKIRRLSFPLKDYTPATEAKGIDEESAAILALSPYLDLSLLTMTVDITNLAWKISLACNEEIPCTAEEILHRCVAEDERVRTIGDLKGLKKVKLTYNVRRFLNSLHCYTQSRVSRKDLEYSLLITVGEIEEELNQMVGGSSL